MSSRGGFRAWPTQRGPRWKGWLAPNLGNESRQAPAFLARRAVFERTRADARNDNYLLTKLSDPVIADDIVRQRLAVSPAPALCGMGPVVARRGPFSLRTYRTFGHHHRPAYGFARMERSTSPSAFSLPGRSAVASAVATRSGLRGRERAVPNAAARRRASASGGRSREGPR